MKSDKILVFIPMYNCEKQISRVVGSILNLKEKQQLFTEVLIVDNQSKDNSLSVANSAIAQLDIKTTLIRNKKNRGLGGSHKVAFNYALKNKFDYVIVLHGDDQGDISDIIKYIETGKYKEYDSLLGSRFEKESKLINYSKFRIVGNIIFNLFISFMVKRRITDLGSGLNLYKVNYLKEKFYMNYPNNLTFNVYMLLYGIYSKSKFTFFPLTWKEEDQVSNAKLFSQSKEIFMLTLKYVFFSSKLFSKEKNKLSKLSYEYDMISQYEIKK